MTTTARVYTNGKRLALAEPTTAIAWLGDAAMFALGDGNVARVGADGAVVRTQAHNGSILCAIAHPEGGGLLTGGDDGRLALTNADGATEEFAALGRKWIDHVIASPATGLVVAAQGKDAIVFKPKSREPSHRFTHPSTIGGLAFDAKGRRLAASHYGGATVRYALIAEDKGMNLVWAGSHLAVTLAPDGDYAITGMQETGLHGWRLPDKLDLRMTGYPSKTRSFAWDRRGRWLATSGASTAVLWPFTGKMGPQGKAPATVGKREALVACVAFHPRDDLLAIGYADGAAFTVHLDTAAVVELDEPGEGGVTAMAWSADGTRIALADDAGRGAVIAI